MVMVGEKQLKAVVDSIKKMKNKDLSYMTTEV